MVLPIITYFAIGAGFGIGNSITDTTINKDSSETVMEKVLSDENIKKSVMKTVNDAIVKSLKSNTTNISNILNLSNEMDFKMHPDCPPAKTFTVGPISSGNVAKIKLITDVANKSKTDISNDVKKELFEATSTTLDESKTLNEGTVMGDVVSGVIGSVVDGVGGTVAGLGDNVENVLGGSLGGAGFGNKMNTTKVTENIQKVVDTFSDKKVSKEDFENLSDMSFEAELGTENMTAMINEIALGNKLNIDVCAEEITVGSIDFSNNLDGEFESKILNETVEKIATTYIENIEKIADVLKKFKEDDTKGDIAAIGAGVAATLVGAGEGFNKASEGVAGIVTSGGEAVSEAAKGMGEGWRDAAEGTGTGVATASRGIGDGFSKAFKGLGSAISKFIWPLAIVVVVAIIIYLMWKFGGFSAIGSLFSKSDDSEEDDDYDEGEDEFDKKFLSYYML